MNRKREEEEEPQAQPKPKAKCGGGKAEERRKELQVQSLTCDKEYILNKFCSESILNIKKTLIKRLCGIYSRRKSSGTVCR